MAQQSQPSVPFNALRPATWGSLKLIPQALRSKLVGGKASENAQGVALGKENAVNQYAALNPPPKIGDLSHLQSIGPRRNVNQRYVLQPNLNVSKPPLYNHAPGLSGLLVPAGQQPHHHDQPQHFHQSLQTLQQHQQRQSSSMPSSPTMRARQQLPNPNFLPSPAHIPTRLPTPVRINASPGPSPSTSANVPPVLPKPPSPSRSLSQLGAPPANLLGHASTCSSPAASTPTSSAFSLPMPPSILGNLSAIRTSTHQAPRSAQAAPWASSTARSEAAAAGGITTPTSVRPSPPATERSILTALQLPSQQQQLCSITPTSAPVLAPSHPAANAFTLPGTEAIPVAIAVSTLGEAASRPQGASVSPVIAVPSIQAALQQALQAALERKPETFKVDNFEQLFDSMMHPGTATKLDGPLPEDLPDDMRYSETWYRHCRDWNAHHKPSGFYNPVVAPAPETPISSRVVSTPFAAPPLAEQADQAPIPNSQAQAQAQVEQKQQQQGDQQPQQNQQQQRTRLPWAADEPRLSEAACKALEVAHHGLHKVFTPAARSGVSGGGGSLLDQLTKPAAAQVPFTAPRSLLDQLERLHVNIKTTSTAKPPGALDDMAALKSSEQVAAPESAIAGAGTVDDDVAHTAAALTSALEVLARDQAAAGLEATGGAPTLAAAAAPPPTAAVRKVPKLRLVVDGHDTLRLPTAAGASLAEFMSPAPDSARPAPDSARPTSTAATTPGPKTPGGGIVDSVATTAATTPVGRGATSANTPTTVRGTKLSSPSAFDFGLTASADTCAAVQTATAADATAAGETAAEFALPPPLHEISGLLVAAGQTAAPSTQVALTRQDPRHVQALASASSETAAPGMPEPWNPSFPPVTQAALSMVQGGAATRAAATARPPSPVTLLQSAPREMPTPNPSFLQNVAAASTGPSWLVAAVTAVADPVQAAAGAGDAAGPSTSTAPPPPDPLKDIVVGIEKLSTLKHNILAEDKEVDVTSITQMIQLKLAVEQLLARTSTAAQAVVGAAEPSQSEPANAAATAPAAAVPAPSASVPEQAAKASASSTPKKAGFGAFLKSVFSPRSGAKGAQGPIAAFPAPLAPSPPPARSFGTNITSILNTNVPAGSLVSPATTTAMGVTAPRPAATAPLGQTPSSSLADKSRYTALHQKAVARLAEAAAEPAATRPPPSMAAAAAAAAAPNSKPRGDMWQRYEEKIAMHRQQLDTTKSQLDEALRKLNDMQAEFDELLLCLGMESAKNKALCDAMRAAGLDPEPILVAIEEQWLSGGFSD